VDEFAAAIAWVTTVAVFTGTVEVIKACQMRHGTGVSWRDWNPGIDRLGSGGNFGNEGIVSPGIVKWIDDGIGLHERTPLERRAGREARPVDGLFRLFGRNAECDASIEGNKFDLNIEALAVLVRPRCTDASPDGIAALAFADMVNDVAGSLGSGGLIIVRISHGSLLFKFIRLRQSRPDGTAKKSPSEPGRSATGKLKMVGTL